ncbi:MAG: SEC-C domain-containing protein [Clostridia bacterium]|nr:SEC-C domain-containing protein [Clostridia bacterium]
MTDKAAAPDRTPREILMKATQPELADTCIRLGLDCGPGTRKSDMADAIAARLEEAPYLLPSCLGPEAVDALLSQRAAVGQARSARWTCPLWMANDDDLLAYALDELRFFGMAWRTRSEWHVNPFVRRALRLDREARRSLEAEDFVFGAMCRLMLIYGVIPQADALRMLDSYLGKQTKEEERAESEEILLGIWCRRQGMYGLMPDPAAEESADGAEPPILFRDPEAYRPLELIALQRHLAAAGQTWRAWQGGELTGVPDTDILITAQAAQQLQALADELKPDADDLVFALEDAVECLHRGDRTEALEALEEGFGDRELTTSQRWILSRVLDKVPLPQLMGRTIEEVNRFTVGEGLRIRPDAPCPCGSGKRYRKCHGRLS